MFIFLDQRKETLTTEQLPEYLQQIILCIDFWIFIALLYYVVKFRI
jgi:hypothetical protein